MTDFAQTPATGLDQDFISVMESRVATYRFISRLFRVEVDQELLDTLMTMPYPRDTGNPEVTAGYTAIREYLGTADEGTLTDLAIDYVRTFIGSGNDGFSAAYPYESVYTSPKRLTMQDARDEVLVLYHAAGLGKAEDWKESEDHVAVELEFLMVMTQRALDAYLEGDEEKCALIMLQQRNFIEDHLACWLPMLVEDMLKFSKTGVYRGLAQIASGFVKEDLEFLNAVVESDGEEPEERPVVFLEVDVTPADPGNPTAEDLQAALEEAEAAAEAAEQAGKQPALA